MIYTNFYILTSNLKMFLKIVMDQVKHICRLDLFSRLPVCKLCSKLSSILYLAFGLEVFCHLEQKKKNHHQ